MAAEDMLDVDGVGSLSAEEMCRLAEQAAEAARACAASARIAKRVSSLGAQGWEVLCECAQCVLRSARSAAAGVARVGAAAVDAPRTVSETVDGAAGRKLSKRAEREVRALLDGMMVAMRQGRCAMLSSAVCSSKASEAAELVLSLARLPYSGSALGSAVGGAQLGSLMRRVAEVLADIRAAVGEAAEHAMSTAVAVAEMKRKGELVKELSATAEEHEPAADGDGDGGAAKEDGGGEAAAEEEGGASAAVKRRLENARWLAKLSVELCASQEELKRLVGGAPQLIPAVSVAAKEEVFDLLGECLAAAEAPIARHWYENLGGAQEGGADWVQLEAWESLVESELEFVFAAAEPSLLPAPSALGARLLRQAAMVDLDLTLDTLRAQLFDRVVLFAPFAATRDATAPEAAALRRLQRRFDAATGALKKMCAS